MAIPVFEITLPVGRIVKGHPMDRRTVDEKGVPKLNADGSPVTEIFTAVAIQKTPNTSWQDEPWGQQMVQAALGAWGNGEHMAPTFSWKIIDGDSRVPNKKGNVPADQEGYPGHWVLALSTRLEPRCYHHGRYQPHEVIQNKNEIKCGDYVLCVLTAKGNYPSESPGIYLNPEIFALVAAGQEIISASQINAEQALGGIKVQLPPGAMVDPGRQVPQQTQHVPQPGAPAPQQTQHVPQAQAPAPAPTPAPYTAVKLYSVAGAQWSEADLLAAGWTPEAIAQLPTV